MLDAEDRLMAQQEPKKSKTSRRSHESTVQRANVESSKSFQDNLDGYDEYDNGFDFSSMRTHLPSQVQLSSRPSRTQLFPAVQQVPKQIISQVIYRNR